MPTNYDVESVNYKQFYLLDYEEKHVYTTITKFTQFDCGFALIFCNKVGT